MSQALTTALHDAYESWLATYNDAAIAMHEQTAAIVLRDSQKLSLVAETTNAHLIKLHEIEAEANRILSELADHCGTPTSILCLSRALPSGEGEKLHALANRIVVASRTLMSINRKNHRLAKEPARERPVTLRKTAASRA